MYNSKDWSILLSKCLRDWATGSGPVVGHLKVQVLFGGFSDEINPSLSTDERETLQGMRLCNNFVFLLLKTYLKISI